MKNLSENPSVKFHENLFGGDSLFHADKRADRRKDRGTTGWSGNCYFSVLFALQHHRMETWEVEVKLHDFLTP